MASQMTTKAKDDGHRRLLAKLAKDLKNKHWQECDECKPETPTVCRECIKTRLIEFIQNWSWHAPDAQKLSKPVTCPRCGSWRVMQVGLCRWACNSCGKRWSRKSNKKLETQPRV